MKNVHIIKVKDNRIFELAKLYYSEFLEGGQKHADMWCSLNVPQQLVPQVKRMALAYSRRKRADV